MYRQNIPDTVENRYKMGGHIMAVVMAVVGVMAAAVVEGMMMDKYLGHNCRGGMLIGHSIQSHMLILHNHNRKYFRHNIPPRMLIRHNRRGMLIRRNIQSHMLIRRKNRQNLQQEEVLVSVYKTL